MTTIAVQTRNLGKRYRIGSIESYATLRDRITAAPVAMARAAGRLIQRQPVSPRTDFWALQDIDLDIPEGEVIGIVGRNGAGKSTLLKVLSRITAPTTGEARIRGHVGSLLEVGTGFHPELTGRENIFANGAVLGMRRSAIVKKFDEIVEFSGVEQFIDTPVKHYSSGMRLRLAFAVAAHLDAEVLLVDEVLAVGDAAFQRKCFDRMKDVAKNGRTVIVVSHQMEAIETLCTRAVWIEKGRLIADDTSGKIVRQYLDRMFENSVQDVLAHRKDRTGDGSLRFVSLDIVDSRGNIVPCIMSGEAVTLRLNYVSTVQHSDVEAAIWFKDGLGRRLMCFYTKMTGATFQELPTAGALCCHIPKFPLAPSTYSVDINATVGIKLADKVEYARSIEVVGADFFGHGHKTNGYGDVLCDHQWTVDHRAPVVAA